MVFGWSLGAQRSMNGDGWGRGSDCERHLRALEATGSPSRVLSRSMTASICLQDS